MTQWLVRNSYSPPEDRMAHAALCCDYWPDVQQCTYVCLRAWIYVAQGRPWRLRNVNRRMLFCDKPFREVGR